MSSPEKQVLKSFVCCSCGKLKSEKNYTRNTQVPRGFNARCKTCVSEGFKCTKTNDRVKKSLIDKSEYPKLKNTTAEDWIDMYKFLESIGYDISKDIHIQFCEKHNITPNIRNKYPYRVYHTPQSLGLI